MCCFTQPVDLVKDTHIFARMADKERQLLVYSMVLAAQSELAMVLPLPVVQPAAEDAIRFINLEEYPNFFADLAVGFPVTRGGRHEASLGATTDTELEVVEVGAYEASFVPAIKDFARLDERFSLPADVWKKLPGYEEYGFAVFKLK